MQRVQPFVQGAMELAWDCWEMAKTQYEKAMNNADPRVSDWPLMQSPFPSYTLCFGYATMCVIGPYIMMKREPFRIRPLLIVYNIALVFLSLYMCSEMLITTWHLGYNYVCDLLDYSTDPNSMRLASVMWLFYFSKIIELSDTLFFILRKKSHHLSFLHKYHHCSVVIVTWFTVKWHAGGTFFFPQLLNSFVHTIMYTYYLLCAFGPSLKPYLWWKKYLTMIQLGQFTVVIIHTLQALYYDCNHDYRPLLFLIGYMMSHLVLFSNFFVHTYIRPKEEAVVSGRCNGTHSVENGIHHTSNGKKHL